MRTRLAVVLPLTSLLLTACPQKALVPLAPPPASAEPSAPKPPAYNELLRLDFNQRAQELGLPFFWRADTNDDHTLTPDELAVLWGPYPQQPWVVEGAFSPAFESAWRTMLVALDTSGLSVDEQRRQALLKQELTQGRPTLVETDSAKFGPEERTALARLLEAAVLVEKLYAHQNGTLELAAKVPATDLLSRAVFYRNQSPFCVAPKTENEAGCTALPGVKRVVGLYPAALQADPKFCEQLEAQPNGKALSSDHFAIVVNDGAGFKSQPYTEAWKADMEAVAKKLEEAAAALPTNEAAFKAYLLAAATAFRTNDWEPANAAWVAMGPNNSKWYLRVGPDEVYYEPCAWKAGFAGAARAHQP
jgi:hypothetical protein